MKQTIEGFNQEYALKLEGVDEYGTVIKLDHTDLLFCAGLPTFIQPCRTKSLTVENG